MGLVTDIAIGLPIGIMYNIFCHKVGEIINANFEYKEKVQRNLILTFVTGVLAIVLAITVFSEHKKFKNRAIKFGLYVGAILLLFHTLLYNWTILENDTKLFIILSALVGLIWYSYRPSNNRSISVVSDDDANMSDLLPLTYTDYAENFDDDD
jgi:hypothetical protein